ncbi:hypothetical protein CLOM_g13012 [Closterium sp. NIES-68]|nr:hypothetical protein CLOM_g13012 [Closterium sp. NIES-68]GJP76315.1 hypothetical protein CLOP_g6779 [Closterium sp. NIES-67]
MMDSRAGKGRGDGTTWGFRRVGSRDLRVLLIAMAAAILLIASFSRPRASADERDLLEDAGGLPTDIDEDAVAAMDEWDAIDRLPWHRVPPPPGALPGGNGTQGGDGAGAAGEEGEGAEGDEGAGGKGKKKKKKAKKPPPPVRRIVEVAEADACAVPRPVVACRLPKGQRVELVFVSAMWEREAQTKDETESMLKSLLYGTRCPLHIHFIIAGEPEQSALRSLMASLKATELFPNPSPYIHPKRRGATVGNPSAKDLAARGYSNGVPSRQRAAVLFSLHYLPMEYVVERAKALHLWPLAHHAGVPGMSKFFMAEILWQVQRAIYLDVDMIVAGDIQDLWDFFLSMAHDPDLLYFISNNHPEGANARRLLRPYCSCQMVLDLQRMRQANLTQLFVDTLGPHKPKELADYVEDGDQFLFMWTCKQMPNRCRVLPRLWNVSGCTKPLPFLGLTSRGREANGSCWRIVHFNCMGHTRGGQGSYVVPPEWEEAASWTRSLRLEDLRRLPIA